MIQDDEEDAAAHRLNKLEIKQKIEVGLNELSSLNSPQLKYNKNRYSIRDSEISFNSINESSKQDSQIVPNDSEDENAMLKESSDHSNLKDSLTKNHELYDRKIKTDFDLYLGGTKKQEFDQNQEDTPRIFYTRIENKSKNKCTNYKDYNDID